MKQIEGFKKLVFSNRKIADQLERSPQTINNAIHKGAISQQREQKQNGEVYVQYYEIYSAYAHFETYLKTFTVWARSKMGRDRRINRVGRCEST